MTPNRGEAYQLASLKAGTDLSGTQIAATSPVAVFGGQHCAQVPVGVDAGDHVVEQLPPTRAWGTRFVSMPFATRLKGDTFRFLASADGTTIAVNGKTVATLARGALHEQIVVGPAEIVGSAPLLVAQYANGQAYDKKPGDPSMTIVPPVEQFLASYDVAIPPDRFASYVNVVAPSVIVGAVALDGVPVPEDAFTPVGTSGFSGAQVAVKPGAHRLTGPLPFGAVVYGFVTNEAYAYPAGMGGASLDAFASLVTGGGFLGSGGDRASFGFVARHAKSALTEASRTEVHVNAPGLRFRSDPDGSLLVLGARAHLFATGRVDGEPGYRIALTAIDGGLDPGRDADRARIQISGPEGVWYDSSEGATDLDAWLTAPLGGGSIVIHR